MLDRRAPAAASGHEPHRAAEQMLELGAQAGARLDAKLAAEAHTTLVGELDHDLRAPREGSEDALEVLEHRGEPAIVADADVQRFRRRRLEHRGVSTGQLLGVGAKRLDRLRDHGCPALLLLVDAPAHEHDRVDGE